MSYLNQVWDLRPLLVLEILCISYFFGCLFEVKLGFAGLLLAEFIKFLPTDGEFYNFLPTYDEF